MVPQRIVSFLPSATETIFALGAGDRLVGVTHECDFPAAACHKPVVVRPTLPLEKMSASEIDAAVSGQLANGGSIYWVDTALLAHLRPELIVSQDLCAVCAPSQNEIVRALEQLPQPPRVISLTPRRLAEVLENVREIGEAIGCRAEADALINDAHKRLDVVRSITGAGTQRPRVFCMEWTDPIYCSGHWVPEMVEIAGGLDAISRNGSDSVRVNWEEVVQFAPEVLVVAPCGFSLADAIRQAAALPVLPGWRDLPAVKNRRVFAVDANSYFARPGPRLVDGVELLAHLIQPERIAWRGAVDAFSPLN